jgi:6-pyruvoyltetrahydropterin/6-carboxytetrahydropterin synthase
MRVTKTMTFEAAHRLANHTGACSNLHGHTYTVELSLDAEDVNPQTGMVTDFGSVRHAMEDLLKGPNGWDHAVILDKADPLLAHLRAFSEALRLVPFDGPPTAERMAAVLAQRYLEQTGVEPSEVAVWETETSVAIWP